MLRGLPRNENFLSYKCLVGLPRGSLLLKDDAFVELLQFKAKKLFATTEFYRSYK